MYVHVHQVINAVFETPKYPVIAPERPGVKFRSVKIPISNNIVSPAHVTLAILTQNWLHQDKYQSMLAKFKDTPQLRPLQKLCN